MLVYYGQMVRWIKMKLGGGRPQPRPHCVRRGPSPPPKKGHSPQFSAQVHCGQMAGWIKMLLGMEVGLGPGDFVLDGAQLPSKKGGTAPNFWRVCIVAKRSFISVTVEFLYYILQQNNRTLLLTAIQSLKTDEVNIITIARRECGPMPNLMVALPNTGGALCSTPQSLADAHY